VSDFKSFDLLEAVELWATENGLIDSEQELSDRFDEEYLPHIIEQYGEDDQPAIEEGFSNWSDKLCKDDQLHDVQSSLYVYVGKRAELEE